MQPTLDGGPVTTFDPTGHGLWDRFIEDGKIAHGEWMRACSAVPPEHVGTCRSCGARLRPRRPRHYGQRTDYEAACIGCGQEILAPGGRVLIRQASTPDGGPR